MRDSDRRAAIIRAVWQVIAGRGMSSVSMRNVAAAAGVSVGQIQYWFRSKEELLRAGLAEMLAGAQELYPSDVTGADPVETLWQVIGHPIPRSAAFRTGVSVFHQYAAAAINDPGLAHMLAQAKNGQEREAAGLLNAINPDLADPREAARVLIAAADGLVVRVLIGSLSAAAAERALRAELDRVIGRNQ